MSFKGKMILLILFIFVIVAAFLVYNTIAIDKASKEHKETVSQVKEEEPKKDTQKEKLELTQDSIELEIGAVFDFKLYIKVAENKYGYSVKDQIKVNGKIPTDKEGKYQVEYIMDLSEGKCISRILHVTVRRF